LKSKVPVSLFLVLLLEVMALGATFPVIAYYVRGFGGTATFVTLCFFLTAGPKIFCQPFWGGVSDRVGRKPIMVIALVGSALSYVGWAIAPNLWWLLASRLLVGMFGAQLTLGTSIVADRLPPEERAKGMGMLGATAGIGFILGPLLGGIVAASTSYATVGWMNAGFELLAIGIALAFLPETLSSGSGANADHPRTVSLPVLKAWKRALAHSTIGKVLVATFLGTLGMSVLHGTVVLVGEDRWGFDVAYMGKALAFFGLIGVLIQGGALRKLVPKWGEVRLARVGLFLTAIGLCVLAIEGSVSLLWISLALVATGSSLMTPTMTALLSQHTDPKDQGRIQGFNQGVTGLGRAGSGVSMGWIYQTFGQAVPFMISAGFTFLGFVLMCKPAKKDENLKL